MRVISKIINDLFGSQEGSLRINHPVFLGGTNQKALKRTLVLELRASSGEDQFRVGLFKIIEELRAKDDREDLARQKVVLVRGDPLGSIKTHATAWDDRVDMGVIGERLSPCVKNCGKANAGFKPRLSHFLQRL